jgi:uncharacterized protein GlcG (DUF336 family)
MSRPFHRLALLASAFTVAGVALPAQAQLIPHRDLSTATALTIATGTLEACKGMGYAVSVVVLDRGGNAIVTVRADDASPLSMENARRKAYTARMFGISTQQFIDEMKTRPVRREQTSLPGVIAINGGVPIKVGSDVIGGVGASGSPGKDEECVNAGLAKAKPALQ